MKRILRRKAIQFLIALFFLYVFVQCSLKAAACEPVAESATLHAYAFADDTANVYRISEELSHQFLPSEYYAEHFLDCVLVVTFSGSTPIVTVDCDLGEEDFEVGQFLILDGTNVVATFSAKYDGGTMQIIIIEEL